MKQLQEKDLEKLSVLSGVNVVDLQKLHALGVFAPNAVINQLILYDYKRIKQGRRYTVRQVVTAIAQEYQVARNTVMNAIYQKRKKSFICTKCGRVVTKGELKRNEGLCDQCVINNIQI